jgi:uncharacterized C2H2 Zn-finger protein
MQISDSDLKLVESNTRPKQGSDAQECLHDPSFKSLKPIRDGKNFRCPLCNMMFAQKDFYINHLKQEHWTNPEVKQYISRLEDQKYNSHYSVPITEAVIKRPRVNIISEQDIVKNEQELLQRIVLTSNMQKPAEKIQSKVLEIKPALTENPTTNPKTERIIIPPPKKRLRGKKKHQFMLGKRD